MGYTMGTGVRGDFGSCVNVSIIYAITIVSYGVRPKLLPYTNFYLEVYTP